MFIVRRVAVEVKGVKVVELNYGWWANARQTLHIRIYHRCVHPSHIVYKHSLIFLIHHLGILYIKSAHRHLASLRPNIGTDTSFFRSAPEVAKRVHHGDLLAILSARTRTGSRGEGSHRHIGSMLLVYLLLVYHIV